jgi:hypothetical protein
MRIGHLPGSRRKKEEKMRRVKSVSWSRAKTRVLSSGWFVFLFLLVFYWMGIAHSQEIWLNYTNNSEITCLAIEGDYIWEGTTGGVVKRSMTNPLTDVVYYHKANSGLASNNVTSIAIDGSGNKWFGTLGEGVSRFDGANWTTYNTSNSGLASNDVLSIAIDGSGNKWFGTYYGGVSRFDGANWTTYNTSNSGLASNNVGFIAIDGSGNKWFGFGTLGEGVSRFDGIGWTTYNTSNSGLADNWVLSIGIDGSGNKWFGTGKGVSRFDGVNWTTYNTSNSGLANNYVWSIAIDGSGSKWFGTYGGGVSRFDGANWTTYNTSNSGLTHNEVHSIAIDGSGNKWFGSYYGGVSYLGKPTAVPEEPEQGNTPHTFALYQNYPNPFNPSTNILFSVYGSHFIVHSPIHEKAVNSSLFMVDSPIHTTLKVYNVKGQLVRTLVDEEKLPGNYNIIWDGKENSGKEVSSGIYFYQLKTKDYTDTKKMVLVR